MTELERAYLRAQARFELARIAREAMTGVAVYAVIDEYRAAAAELRQAAEALIGSAP